MKILWLVNIVMPELAVHLGEKASVFGGWLTGAMQAVRGSGNRLVICTAAEDVNKTASYCIHNVTYYIVPRTDVSAMQIEFRKILDSEQPDVIHLYGTEFEHAWAMASVADPDKTLVTIQGALTYYKEVAFAGLPEKICRDNAMHKLLRLVHKGGQSIELQKQSFDYRSEYERKVLRSVNYINGGSEWGKAVAQTIHPDCTTLDCGLILRELFYTDETWSYDDCEPHTIYALLSYPVKGFHKLLDALPIVLEQFPDTKVYVVGNQLIYRHYKGIKKRVQNAAPDYQWYVQQQIEQMHLQDHLEFLGYLPEEEVKARLLKSNVFVSASSIENQSTALGEAMILGVPSVASCVGAIQEMIDHGRDGFLYPFNEPHMLAYYVCRIFEDRALAEQFSVAGHLHAARTYNREENCYKLLEMYRKISENIR